MIDSFVLLTPLLMLGVLALVRFIGCNQVFGLDETVAAAAPPTNLMPVSGDRRVDLTWDYEHGDATKFEVWYHETGNVYALYSGAEIHIEATQGQVQHARTSIVNLTNHITYFFKVRAFTAHSSSSLAEVVEKSATPGVTEFVATVITAGSVRNNFSGWLGMAVQMNDDAIVTQLGRTVVANNIRTHDIRIVDPAQGNIVLGTVTVSMPAGPIGAFAYQPLPQPVALQRFRLYYFLAHEDSGGDNFYDILGSSVATTPIGNIISGVYSDDTAPDTYMLIGSNNQMYGLVNFTY